MKTQAVLTGDIINFTKLPPGERKVLIENTEALLKSWVKEKENVEIFRGDSYQILFKDVSESVKRSIQLVCWFKMHSKEDNTVEIGTRISLGIGEVSYYGETVLKSDGEAFHLSGRNFDQMKDGEYIIINTRDQDKNTGIGILLNFINKYISKWTKGQAEVIFLLLEGNTQQEIAKALSLSQPSVNSRLRSAGWREFEPTIKYIADIIK